MARWLSLVLLAVLVASAVGCRKAVESTVDRNKPPSTWITSAPADSSEGPYKFHIYWGGTDPDGVVVGYLIAVTDSVNLPEPPRVAPDPKDQLDTLRADPRFTTRTDSLFTFTANDPLVLAHRVYIAAIDNQGKYDQQALTVGHFIYFLARNRFAPQVFIDREVMNYRNEDHDSDHPVLGNGHLTTIVGYQDTMPSNSSIRLRWHGADRDPGSRVVGFTYHLDRPMFALPDRGSHEAKFPDTSVAPESCALCQSFLPDGQYTLTVDATDEAGAKSDPSSNTPESFVVGFDPVTFLVSGSEVRGDVTRPLNFGGSYLYTPQSPLSGIKIPGRDPSLPISMTVPYVVNATTGRPDTIADYATISFNFVAADSAGGDRGLVSQWQPAAGPQTVHESYQQYYSGFGDNQVIARGLNPGFNSGQVVTLDAPAEIAQFSWSFPLTGSNYSGQNQIRVRSRDQGTRWDGIHTYYPNAVFEVNRAPVYALPSTYLQAGDANGPLATNPRFYASGSDGSGPFTSGALSMIDLTPASPVLWVVFGPDSDPDPPTPAPSDWVAKRAVLQATSVNGQPVVGELILGQWITTHTQGSTVSQTSFPDLTDGTTYRMDIALRDHASQCEGSTCALGRNWTAWSAYKHGALAAPLTFTVRVTR